MSNSEITHPKDGQNPALTLNLNSSPQTFPKWISCLQTELGFRTCIIQPQMAWIRRYMFCLAPRSDNDKIDTQN